MKTKKFHLLRIYAPISINPGDGFNDLTFELDEVDSLDLIRRLYYSSPELKCEEFEGLIDKEYEKIYSDEQ